MCDLLYNYLNKSLVIVRTYRIFFIMKLLVFSFSLAAQIRRTTRTKQWKQLCNSYCTVNCIFEDKIILPIHICTINYVLNEIDSTWRTNPKFKDKLLEFWKAIFLTDENKFELLNRKLRARVFEWFSWSKVRSLVKMDGIINADSYINILQENQEVSPFQQALLKSLLPP